MFPPRHSTDDSRRIAAAAAALYDARTSLRPFGGFPPGCAPRDEAEGYAVQDALHERLHERGPLVGSKIGCTTRVMQAFLGIAAPCAGGIFAKTVYATDAEVPHDAFVRPGVECELAVVLGDDLPHDDVPLDRERVARAIDACMAAIEIVDDRYVDYASLGAPALIADDFFGAGCVLGPRRRFDPRDLAAVGASMLVNGRTAGTGSGADILGEPLEALAWLARHRADRGDPLRAGELVLLGSVVQTQWIARGDDVEIVNARLGTVRARFR